MGNFNHRALMVSASVSAYTAPALMTICLLTDYWIYGKQTRLSQNPVIKAGDIRILNFTYHRIGLWRECTREAFESPYVCELVRYSKTEAKLEKGFKAVSYRSAPSMVCFTAASVLLIIAVFLFTRGLCKRRRKAVFFISGLLFSISGLLTMVGVTLYVSITTEESVKIDQDYPVMKCFYGYSFLCAVLSFVLQELTGVLTVYWFIYRFRALVRKQEKLRERTRQLMGNCLSMTTALPLNLAAFNSMSTTSKSNSMAPRSDQQPSGNHLLTPNSARYQYPGGDPAHAPAYRNQMGQQQRRRVPFDRSSPSSPSLTQRSEKNSYSSAPPRSPTLPYGDYCRVLIRAEDMDLFSQMVRSRSQAQLLINSRPTTPASAAPPPVPIVNVKVASSSNPHRRTADQATRRTIRKDCLSAMAHNGRNSSYQPTYYNDPRDSVRQQPDEHIYEEQPYYANDRPISRQSMSRANGRHDEVIYSTADVDYSRPSATHSKLSNGHSTQQYKPHGGQEQFLCHHCERNLSGSRYILKDEHPYCIKCYEDRYSNSCEECQRRIGTDSKDLSYKDRHWHEKCFFCSVCKTPLVDKPFGCKNEQLYCGECYNQQFASRCDKCNQIFKPGTRKLEYHGQQFHEHCFTCVSCSQPIGTKSFIPKEQKSYCVPCYEEKFATKCTSCSKVIDQGGVTYKNQPWHRDCFTCTNCRSSLAGQRFTSRDDHPYCADCFARLFAKKCFACTRPITGVGGTRYISFEERHWHNDCFVCKRCRSSLVGRGFLTEGQEILCPDCGKRDSYHPTETNSYGNGHRSIVNDYHQPN